MCAVLLLCSCRDEPRVVNGTIYQGDTLYAPLVLAEQFSWRVLYKDSFMIPETDSMLVMLKYYYPSPHEETVSAVMFVHSQFVAKNHAMLPDSILGCGFHTLRPEDLIDRLMDRYFVRPAVLLYFKRL